MKYRITVHLAGRRGEQIEETDNKRGSVRRCRALVAEGGFGSAGEVRDIQDARPQLIYQCHVARNKKGKDFVKTDEL